MAIDSIGTHRREARMALDGAPRLQRVGSHEAREADEDDCPAARSIDAAAEVHEGDGLRDDHLVVAAGRPSAREQQTAQRDLRRAEM